MRELLSVAVHARVRAIWVEPIRLEWIQELLGHRPVEEYRRRGAVLGCYCSILSAQVPSAGSTRLSDLAGRFAKATETPFASRTRPDPGVLIREVSHDHHHAVSGLRPDGDAQAPHVMLALRGEVAEDRARVTS